MNKSLTSLILTCIPFSLLASEPFTENRLGNLNFYTPAEHLTMSANFSAFAYDEFKDFDQGVRTSHNDYTKYYGAVSASYGILDGLRFSAELPFEFNESVDHHDDTPGTSTPLTSYSYSGVGDPVFTGQYRLVSFAQSAIAVDMGAAYSPSLANGKSASPGYDGNYFPGYHYAEAFLHFYWTKDIHEVEVSTTLRFDSSAKIDAQSSDNSYHRSNGFIPEASIFYRLHSDKLYTQFGLNFTGPYEMNYTYGKTGTFKSLANYPTFSPNLAVGYLILPQLLASADISYTYYQTDSVDNYVDSKSVAQESFLNSVEHQVVVNIGASYLF